MRNRMYHKALIFLKYMCCVATVLLTVKTQAQTEPMYSQYMFNMLSVNPGYAGNREALGLNVFHRIQWSGLKGAPKTTSVSIDAAAKDKRIGWGMQMYDDQLGVEHATGFSGMLSTKVRVSETGILSAGLSFGMLNYKVNLNDVANRNTVGDNVFSQNFSKWQMSSGLGIYYNTDRFYAGLSSPDLFLNSRLSALQIAKSSLGNNATKHIFLNAGYVMDLNEDLKLKPSTMLKMSTGAPMELDLNANLWVKELVSVGFSYRTGDAIVNMVEAQLNENLRFGYAYDITISPLKYFNNGSHEFMVRYEWGNGRTKIKSTRYF